MPMVDGAGEGAFQARQIAQHMRLAGSGNLQLIQFYEKVGG